MQLFKRGARKKEGLAAIRTIADRICPNKKEGMAD